MWTRTLSNLRRLGLFLAGTLALSAAEPVRFAVDVTRTNGLLRPLHGVNKGPIAAGGTIDLTEQHRQLGIPFTRLHDCLWPYPDVVDVHAIFRNPAADPALAESYDFALTDEYLAAVHRTGARMVYRLGESIEHMSTKRFVHPPPDAEKWAQVGLGIIRHYQEGWANGFEYEIPYVEIWNEPENRPAMWSGSDDDFLRLYTTAARQIKQRFPKIKVGGPGFGATGSLKNGRLQPTAFLSNFLKHCRSQGVPLDFLSWHCYTANVGELVARAKEIRRLLDAEGLVQTESHLNEWNYLPDNTWEPFGRSAPARLRREFYTRAQGGEGGSFALAALIQLQDAAVDVANFFHGEIGGFGLFDEFGGETEVFHAFRAFHQFMSRTPIRVQTTPERSGQVSVITGTNREGTMASILLSNPSPQPERVEITFGSWPVADRKPPVFTLLGGGDPGKSGFESKGNRLSFRLEKHSGALIQFSAE